MLLIRAASPIFATPVAEGEEERVIPYPEPISRLPSRGEIGELVDLRPHSARRRIRFRTTYLVRTARPPPNLLLSSINPLQHRIPLHPNPTPTPPLPHPPKIPSASARPPPPSLHAAAAVLPFTWGRQALGREARAGELERAREQRRRRGGGRGGGDGGGAPARGGEEEGRRGACAPLRSCAHTVGGRRRRGSDVGRWIWLGRWIDGWCTRLTFSRVFTLI
ncbi:hypothetical protein DAI22_11g042400 [Oryza sativa Japonica Group]|jgi:hypothetical protein|nr:hypothetical protein DAI22_11g042400 [Oryza sativa Japonica Group]